MKARLALAASVVSLVFFATMTVVSFSPAGMPPPIVQVDGLYAAWMMVTAAYMLATLASAWKVAVFARACVVESRKTVTCARRLPPPLASARRFAAAAEGHYQGLAQVW